MTLVKQLFEDLTRSSVQAPLAVIDIGSNSVRLVVYEGASRSPAVMFNEKVLCGLGRSVATTGRLDEAAVQRAITALARFRAIAEVLKVKSIQVFATAAVREAENGAWFISEGQNACGAPIRLLTGEEEARLAAQGIAMGIVDPDGIAGDLGGGSLELIDLQNRELRQAATLPLGGLRLIDMTDNKVDKAVAIIEQQLNRVDWLKRGKGRTFYAVGGTWRAIATMHMAHTDYPLHVMHGYSVPTAEMIEYAGMIRKAKKLSSLRGASNVSKARREVLPMGAAVLEQLLIRLAPANVQISAFGVREGFLHDLLPLDQKTQDPLLAAAGELALLRSRSVRHAHELAACAGKAFAAFGIDETPDEMRYRQAACLLADIGWRAHPDYRGTQSLNIISHASFVGVDHPGRCYLALAAAFRHEGLNASVAKELQELTPPRLLHRARILAGLMRVFYLLSASMPGILPRLQWVPTEDDALQLLLPRDMGGLHGERPRGRLDQLARLVGRKLDLVVEPEPVH